MKKTFILLSLLIITSISFAQGRTVLIEYILTPSSWTVKKLHHAKIIQRNNPNDILVVEIHQFDSLGCLDPTYISDANPSYGANFDRTLKQEYPETWQTQINTRLSVPPSAGINVTFTFNDSTRELTLYTRVNITNSIVGYFINVGAILVEDCVYGTTPEYSLVNTASGDTSTLYPEYEHFRNPIPAKYMVYDNVARDLITTYRGQQNNWGWNHPSGTIYFDTIKYIVPQRFNPNYTKTYIYLSDSLNGKIINTTSTSYLNGNNNAVPIIHGDTVFNTIINTPFEFDILAHDFESDSLTYRIGNQLPSWANFNMVGSNNASITGIATNTGTYNFYISVSDGIDSLLKIIQINVLNPSSKWMPLGDSTVLDSSNITVMDMAIDKSTNTIYILSINKNHDGFVYKFTNNQWQQLGTKIDCYSDKKSGAIAFNPVTHEPWIHVIGNNKNRVYKYSSGSWTQVGLERDDDKNVDIEINNAGEVFVSNNDYENKSLDILKWDNNNWVSICNLFPDFYYSNPCIELNNNGKLYLLVNFNNQSNICSYPKVYKFNGSSWSDLGFVNINNRCISEHNEIAIGKNDEIYVALSHYKDLYIYQYNYNNNEWDTIYKKYNGILNDNYSICTGINGELYFVYENEVNKAECLIYDGNSWQQVGLADFTPSLVSLDCEVYSNGFPVMAYTDYYNNKKLYAKYYDTPAFIKDEILDPEKEKLIIFPNPTSNYAVIENIEIGEIIIIYDLSGKTIWEGENTNNTINVTYLTEGAYIIKAGNKASKLIIKR